MSTTFTPIQEIDLEKLIEKLKAYKGAEVSNVLYGTGDDALYSNHRRELYN